MHIEGYFEGTRFDWAEGFQFISRTRFGVAAVAAVARLEFASRNIRKRMISGLRISGIVTDDVTTLLSCYDGGIRLPGDCDS